MKARYRETNVGGRILVVDDHRQARESMAEALRHFGHEVRCCSSAPEALNVLNAESYDCVVTDLKMPGMNGIEFIMQLEERKSESQVVMVTAHASVASAVEAMRHGAFDYIEKPFDIEQLEDLVDRALRHGKLVRPVSGLSKTGVSNVTDDATSMIGSSSQMEGLRQRIAQIAPTSETVLITGESGTGKELVAKAIHAASNRAGGPLVSLNCPVLSAQLMESELFGHERGAFTGADTSRTGRFEMADGGSILLDEVTEIELPLQAKLLRVLQERSFERVGSSETIAIDARVMATSNRDLQAEIQQQRFREDLYYRLAVVPIHVPPLRDRRDDIPELVEHFFARCAERLDRKPCQLDGAAQDMLLSYHWPGNVRELENIVTRASVLCLDGTVGADELRRWLAGHEDSGDSEVATTEKAGDADLPVGVSLKEMERRMIEATLERFNGHRAKTAEALGIGVRTLSDRLRQYGYAPREKSFSKAG